MNLDPYDTGFVPWQRFIFTIAKLAPITIEKLVEVKTAALNVTNDLRHLDRQAFLSLDMWFDTEEDTIAKFNRPRKIKGLLPGIVW